MKISFEKNNDRRRKFTTEAYNRVYELYIQPIFGNKKLDSIKVSELSIWQNKLHKTLHSSTVNKARSVFYTILDDARKDEIIEKNIFTLVDRVKIDESEAIHPFSISEIFTIINNMPDKIKAFFAIGFLTGMRTGEILALKWDNIDLKEKVIRVRKSIRRGIEDLPKTKSSIRDVIIIDALIPYLQDHYKLLNKKTTYLFETQHKQPFKSTDRIASYYWHPLLQKLNIGRRKLYQMRHTFASLMISNGEDILWVSHTMGHSTSKTTLEKYAKFIKSEKKERGRFLIQI
jgi:integrase